MRSIMEHRWSNLGQRQLRRARALRASPHVEQLERRNLLTNSLVVVPSPVITQGHLIGTAAIANNDIWAVGGLLDRLARPVVFRPIAEHFDGNSWQVVPTPALEHGGELLSVAAVASNDVWAVGFQSPPPPGGFGESLIEHWDGSSWTIIDSPTSMVQHTSLTGVTAISSNDVWAVGEGVGDHHSDALVEHWDGSSWSVVSSSAFPGVDVEKISADAGNDIWALGLASTFFGGPFSGPAALHFDGTSWTVSPTNTQMFLLPTAEGGSVKALSPTDVWAVGVIFNDFDLPDAAIAHWDGTQWTDVPSPRIDDPRHDSQLAGVAAISPSDIWAVGAIGDFSNDRPETLTEHWDGTSWSIIPSPNPGNRRNSALFGVTALSDGTVAAVGRQPDVNSSQSTPLILQNPESAPPGSGPAVPAAPLFVHASADPRWSLAGPSTVSKVAMLDTPLLQDQLNARSVDPVFASGKPDPALRLAHDRSLAPQGPEEHVGRMDAIDRLFTEWFVVPALAG
jgi:hypothetical protein